MVQVSSVINTTQTIGTSPLSQRSAIANFVADFLQGLGLGLGLGLVSVIVTGSYSLYPVQSTLDLCDSGPLR